MTVRTANPNGYLDSFQKQVSESLERYRRLESILDGAKEPDPIKKGVAEDTAFRLGVLWETFQGDWYVAAISRDPSAFVGAIQGQLNAVVNDTWAKSVIESFAPTALTVPKRPTMAQIVKMLDPQGSNVTFVDVRSWKKDADKHLAGDYRGRVNAIASDTDASSLIHLVKKMRNYLAHGSDTSKDEFNRAARGRAGTQRIGLVGAANAPLQRDGRGVSDMGKYLRARQSANRPRRLEVLHDRLADVAEVLRVSNGYE